MKKTSFHGKSSLRLENDLKVLKNEFHRLLFLKEIYRILTFSKKLFKKTIFYNREEPMKADDPK